MSLILKQESSNVVPTPIPGKATLYVTPENDIVIKGADGNTSTFITALGTDNTQVLFNDQGSIVGNNGLRFDNTSNTLTVTGNVEAAGLKTDNIYYANGTPWDMQQPSGSNTQIQFNNNNNFGASANLTFDSATNKLTITGNIQANNAELGNLVNANYFNGTLTYAAQPNITSVGTLQNVKIGATSSETDYPGAIAIASQDNSGGTSTDNIGLIGEAVANSANASITGIGVLGHARANGATKATGVEGRAFVTSTADTGAAVGIRGYSLDTHAAGYNIGVLGNAAGSGIGNYAFYVQSGGIGSIENDNVIWDLADDSVAAIQFNSTGKANIFGIETTDGAEGIYTQGYLNVTGNATVGGLKTNNIYYANGQPWDMQQPAGSNTQIQFNLDGNFGATGNLTYDDLIQTLTVNGNIVADNANLGNLATANFVAGTLTTAAQPNVTSVGTLTSLAVTGNITSGNANVGNLLTANYVAGTLTTAAQPNITSVGSLSNLTIAANGNITMSGANSRLSGANAVSATYLTGTLTTAAQPNITSVGTLSSLSVTGNVSAGNVSGTLLTGTLTTAAQPNITSVGTLSSLSVTGNVSAGNVSGTLLTGTLATAAQPNVTSVGSLTGLTMAANADITLSGTGSNISGANLVSATYLTGTLTTAAQPNVTSVGTLTSLGVNGTVTAVAFTANTGVFTGNGSGLSAIAGANVTGTVANATYATSAGSATTAGTVTTNAQPNITSVGTLSSLSVTGNANVGNLGTGGLITATGNVSGGNITTAGQLVSSVAVGTAPLVVTSTTRVNNLNVAYANVADFINVTAPGTGTGYVLFANTTSGNVAEYVSSGITSNLANNSITATTFVGALSGAATSATTAGTVTTNAQPNITSVGTLTSLGVNGTVTAVAFTANTGVFTGNGSGLSAIAGANVTGTVSSATSATTAGTVTTNAQPNITSVGTLSSLTVTGNVSAGNVSGTLLTGTLTTAAQPNITSVGTLSSLTVTGNVSAGNVSGTLLTGTLATAAQPNVTSLGTLSSLVVSGNIQSNANVITNLIQGRTTGVTITAAGTDQNINLTPTGTGTVNVGNFRISNVAEPVNDSDAATKFYVDTVAAQGLHVQEGVDAATSGTLTSVTGGTITYNNGNAGVGATLTTSSGNFLLIDGVTLTTNPTMNPDNGGRVLVKNEANAAHNGIYYVTSNTVLTRDPLFDSDPEVEGGDFVFVVEGTVNASTGWVQTATVNTIGTDPIVWQQFSGAGTYTAGTGLTLTGTEFKIANTTVSAGSYGNGDRVATFTVNGQGQLSAASNVAITANAANLTGTTLSSTVVTSSLTSVGTLGSLSVTGNVSAGNVSGTLLTGTLTTAAQPNVTSVGTLTGLGVNGTVTAVNFTANTGVFSGNGASLTSINANAITSGTLAQARLANSSLTVNGTAISLGGSATITANTTQTLTLGSYLTGTSFNGGTAVTATVDATSASTANKVVARDANGSFSANIITATLSGSATSAGTATTAGTVTTNAQPNITSVGTLTSLGVNGTVTAVAFTANTGVFTGNGNGLSSIVGANVTGTVANATYNKCTTEYH